ncbi:membrane protein insertion efficiency factor YidD [bacterium]|nr:membrane protein insertion efficiency factor YidD [bacterium]
MPSLRKLKTNPYFWLLMFMLPFFLGFADSFRSPGKQVSARLYIQGVGLYHRCSHFGTSGFIKCRYEPTCSRYSVEAVRRYGIRKGLVLTVRRISSCRQSVPPGTYDPVP